jgi:hypothetical protein
VTFKEWRLDLERINTPNVELANELKGGFKDNIQRKILIRAEKKT